MIQVLRNLAGFLSQKKYLRSGNHSLNSDLLAGIKAGYILQWHWTGWKDN